VLDEQGARYAAILRTWEVPISVYEITGTLGIPSFAFCVGDQTVAYQTGVDVRAAVCRGLEQTVAHVQARTTHQPDYAPPDVADLPHRARGMRPTLPPSMSRPNGSGDWLHQQHRMCDALVRQGYRVVVVPLDHDPAVTDVLPYIVNLVMESR